MHRIDLYFEGDLINVTIDVIKRDEGITIYWCNIYGIGKEKIYCIRFDDNPLIITSSTSKDNKFEKVILNCIDEIEYSNAGNRKETVLQGC
ncbi:MAG: hypothetical protein QM763_10910 [Agriterribacter sp.]